MSTRHMICVTSLVLAGSLVGCGPTKYGKQMRHEAAERLSLVNADISYDQARRSFEVGQFDRAIKEIDRAISRAPTQPDYFVLREHQPERYRKIKKYGLGTANTDAEPSPVLEIRQADYPVVCDL